MKNYMENIEKYPEIHKFWETDTRYYSAHLVKNLLDEWIIDRTWGGKHNRHKGRKFEYCRNYEEGVMKIEKLSKVRNNHKYREI